MRKALPIMLAALALTMGAMSSHGGDIPALTYFPDIVMTDKNPELGQTANNYYIYQGINIEDYIFDEDSSRTTSPPVAVGFTTVNSARLLSIGGKSRMRLQDEQTWIDDGLITPHKNIMATTSTPAFRMTTDLYSADGPNVPPTYVGLRTYGIAGGNKALVSLMVADGQSSAASTLFYVQTSLDSKPSEAINGPLVAPYAPMRILDEFGGINGFLTIPAGTYPNGVFAAATFEGTNFDQLGMNSPSESPSDAIVFGAWQYNNVNIGQTWPTNGLIRATWTVSSSATNPSRIPGIRSRLRPGMGNPEEADDINWKGLNSELRFDPSARYANTALMANNQQINLRHYFYAGNYAQLTKGNLQATIDYIDLPDAFNVSHFQPNGTPVMGRPTGAQINVDRLIVEVIPKPVEGNADHMVNLYNKQGGALMDIGTWFSPLGGGIGFDAPRLPGRGQILAFTTQDGVILRADSAPSGFIGEARVFNMMMNNSLGLFLKDTENDLIRVRARVRRGQEAINRQMPMASARLRLFPGYDEVQGILNIPGYAAGPTYVAPNASGKDYELYMETPLVNVPGAPDNDGKGWPWVFAMDAYTEYHPDQQSLWNEPQLPILAVDFMLTQLRIDRIIKF